TDLLVVLENAGTFRSVYLRGTLPAGLADAIRAQIGQPRCLIMVGTRHRDLRDIALKVATAFRGELLVFSPAYAIYGYGADDLRPLVQRADITIMNHHEAEYLRRVLGVADVYDLATSLSGITIVTRAHEGARVFEGGHVSDFSSYARSTADAFGSGD